MISQIGWSLEEIDREWKEHKGLLLSEDDLKCHLFHKLMLAQGNLFGAPSESINPHINTCPLHTELKYYDNNGVLKYKPDICILNPKKLSIFHDINRPSLPTSGKRFQSYGETIAIELAFIKNKRGLTHMKDVEKVRKDFDKLIKIQDRPGNNQTFGYIVVFSKVDHCRDEFKELVRDIHGAEKIHFFWGSAQIDPSDYPK